MPVGHGIPLEILKFREKMREESEKHNKAAGTGLVMLQKQKYFI